MTYVVNTHKRGTQGIGKYGLLTPGQIKEVPESALPCICGDFVQECDASGKVISATKVVKVRGRAAAAEVETADEQPAKRRVNG